jgi:hypothetical protein
MVSPTLCENWRDIPGYEGRYQVSDGGGVRSIFYQSLTPLKPWLNNMGYLCVTLYKDRKRTKQLVHRLVATVFIPNPHQDDRTQINHKNGVKTDNRAANLEWCSNQENAMHSAYVLRNETTITKRPVICLDTGVIYASVSEAARRVGGCNQNIVKCCQGTRKHAKGLRWAYAEEVTE